MKRYVKHQFAVTAHAGGWDYCDCLVCRRGEIPSPFGFMWSNLRLIQLLFPARRCTESSTQDIEFDLCNHAFHASYDRERDDFYCTACGARYGGCTGDEWSKEF